MRRHLSYANVTATLALVVAVATGGAYAADLIGSDEIRDNSVRSRDLRDRRAVGASDVKKDALGRREIDEGSLDASGFLDVQGAEALDCELTGAPIACAEVEVRLPRRGRLLVVASGGYFGASAPPTSASCEVRIDNQPAAVDLEPGEMTPSTDSSHADGFARTAVSGVLGRGTHSVALTCEEIQAEAEISAPTVMALAIAGR